MAKKPTTRITVNDICQACEINRSTFYRHFVDKYEVLDQIEQDFLNQLFGIPKNDINQSNTIDNLANKLSIYVAQLLDIIQVNQNVLKIILSENGHPGFQNTLKNMLSDRIKESLVFIKGDDMTVDDQLAVDFIATSDVSIILYTLDHPDISHEKIVETFLSLLIKGPLHTIFGN
ncbi:TetR family transcriptional regulator [Lactobacillus sp. S2-2]|uniref:TetR/AcrR family transcriptional regulator n=1 Tax=Lactobacillus sp. S2-2 TaxID=2692917 RepID=UPI001F24550A|nr:TetR/AcrR family transcriptional regulator C-terminal domain-containing protein [Lactobacillus sp. S2-2]MCF6515284.1 TetR family transcriptional regulator [Lactobacillus sp. S2-2]